RSWSPPAITPSKTASACFGSVGQAEAFVVALEDPGLFQAPERIGAVPAVYGYGGLGHAVEQAEGVAQGGRQVAALVGWVEDVQVDPEGGDADHFVFAAAPVRPQVAGAQAGAEINVHGGGELGHLRRGLGDLVGLEPVGVTVLGCPEMEVSRRAGREEGMQEAGATP